MPRTVPTPPSWTANQEITSSLLNQIGSVLAWLQNPPMFRMIQTAAQSVANTTVAQVTMDTVVYDSDNGRQATTPYSYIIPFAGRWSFKYAVSYVGNATGGRTANLTVNGTNVPSSCPTDPGMTAFANMEVGEATVPCNVGDVIAVMAFQNDGAPLSTAVGAQGSFLEGKLESLGNP